MAAIYKPPWPKGIVLTTTLYPIEVVDSATFTSAFHSGYMIPVPSDYMAYSITLQSGSYTQLRWYLEDGPYDDYMEWSIALEGGTYTQLRWYYADGP
jgi:hypothetical protein